MVAADVKDRGQLANWHERGIDLALKLNVGFRIHVRDAVSQVKHQIRFVLGHKRGERRHQAQRAFALFRSGFLTVMNIGHDSNF